MNCGGFTHCAAPETGITSVRHPMWASDSTLTLLGMDRCSRVRILRLLSLVQSQSGLGVKR